MVILKTKPEKVTKKFLSVLPDRSHDVITRRFGLGGQSSKVTLDSIGKGYGITRERVRQIENSAIKNIRKSEAFKGESKIFDELYEIIEQLGGVVSEEDLLSYLHKNDVIQNHIHFLLVLGDPFSKEKENDKFKARWYTDNSLSETVHNALEKLYKELDENNLYTEDEIVTMFSNHAEDIEQKHKNPDTIKRWLNISKNIGRNNFDEWGLSASTNINAKGIRDYAYLSIRQHGSPLHFSEVAKSIEKNFSRKAHIATCHNELIKDPRFVLVGRGLYALTEWGYVGGVVRDVIKNILEKEGALTREEIIEKVLKERYIKENTVVVNLQDAKYFKKDSKGRYLIIK
ncbi:hypothetical protein A2442_03350 [Candidatus Campbellbacteria bacterium RIFOXYC2_FULL_35_25]|uniref:RNA polymerase sigma-70 region 4 domain-containing protein n=1 Tax=Candidatus Campbellbacteria bacterium RIFOXYC2_FULL_35_25 TaxID=1797582 RepID=A0A1F5EHR0_9BACT|nr:MAG: hypothetical protein A2442_03350 [Candidatus Campbellbacteria bacterium RIFOXYC2_FULL_35_25]